MNKLKMMMVGALAVAGAWCARASEGVQYLDPAFDSKGATSGYATRWADCTEINTERLDDYTIHGYDSMTLGSGWYVVTGQMEARTTLTISGDVKIVLKNKSILYVNDCGENNRGGLRVESGSSLTIYAQSTDEYTMGRISAYGGNNAAGIGSGSKNDVDSGRITINGGNVYAKGGGDGAGIGGGHGGRGMYLTINGGIVTATGGKDGAGIGGGYWDGHGEYITINGGTVTANGGGNAAGIGGGCRSFSYDITINGGTVTANGGADGAGIGSGDCINNSKCYAKYITINGGNVTATGGETAAGIGGGQMAGVENITINGGTVKAQGGKDGAGIGGGSRGDAYGITINGGHVTAYGGGFGTGIGSGSRSDKDTYQGGTTVQPGDGRYCERIYFYGGTVYAKAGDPRACDVGQSFYSGALSSDFGISKDFRVWGGSICLLGEKGFHITPKNKAGEDVYKTTVTGLAQSPETITGIPDYGVNDLYPDGDKLYLWLSTGDYDFHSTTKTYSGSANTTINPSGDYWGGFAVNGTELSSSAQSGEGWSYTNNVLTLSEARDYTLSGSEAAGRVRVEVTANANVTLDGVTLCQSQNNETITFKGGATDAKLVLNGDNAILCQNNYSAVGIESGAKVTLSGAGALVGDASWNCRGVWVKSGGTLVMDGGTVKGYKITGSDGGAVYNSGTFTMNGGTLSGCRAICGGALYNSGTAEIHGGSVTDNVAAGGDSYGGFCYDNKDCHTYIYGGYFSGNTAPAGKCNLYVGYGWKPNGALYGGVFAADPILDSSEAPGLHCCLVLQGDAAVGKVDNLYVVGKDVVQENGQLTGGTYTFNPKDDEYAAAGLKVMGNCPVTPHEETTPKTYVVEFLAEFYVNGSLVSTGGGEGWTFDSETGLLSLTNAMEYALSGYCELPLKVDVTADARVNLTDVTITPGALGRKIFNVTAPDVRFSLGGSNVVHTTDGNAAIYVAEGAKLTIDGDGKLVGGRAAGANGRCVTVASDGALVLDGGTICDYYAKDFGGAVYNFGTVRVNGGTISDCQAEKGSSGGGGIYQASGELTMNGGTIAGCTAAYGGAIGVHGGTALICGGAFSGNVGTQNAAIIDSNEATVTLRGGAYTGNGDRPFHTTPDKIRVFGGVYDFQPSTLDKEISLVGVGEKQVGENWIVGQDVTESDGALTGGTYYFDPSREEYAAAGVRLASQHMTEALGTTPETYSVHVAAFFTVDGVRLEDGTGEGGWTFTQDGEKGYLTLAAARAYELSGYADLPLLVDVLSNATVTLNGARIRAGKAGRAIIRVLAEDAILELKGTNTIYATDGYYAVGITAGAKLTVRGDGELVGGKAAGADGSGFGVQNHGELVVDGGTIRDYYRKDDGAAVFNAGTFTVNGGTFSGNAAKSGGALLNNGTAAIHGGRFIDNEATGEDSWGGGFCFDRRALSIYGGYFSGNKAPAKHCNFYVRYGSDQGKLYGGVFAADPTSSAESGDCLALQDGTAVSQVGENFVVGKDVTQQEDLLTGGTYYFDPTAGEYAEAGVALAEDRAVFAQATAPTTYKVSWARTGFTVNGVDLLGPEDKSGLGWNYDRATGLLTLTEGWNYVLSGECARKDLDLGVAVDADYATVVLSNATITSSARSPLTVNAIDVNVHLLGENTLTAPAGCAAIAVPAGKSAKIAHIDPTMTGELVAVTAEGRGANAPAIGGEGDVTVKSGVVTAQGGIVAGNVRIEGGTVTARGSGTDIGGNVVITGGSILAGNVTSPKNEDGDDVWCVTLPGVTHPGPVSLSGLDYGSDDLYPINRELYLWLPDEEYEITVKDKDQEYEELDEHFCVTVNGAPAVAYCMDFFLTVNGEEVTDGDHGDWAYDEYDALLTLKATTNCYALAGESMEGAVRVVVETNCTVTLGGVQLGMGEVEEWGGDPQNLFFVKAGTVDLVLDGMTAFQVNAGAAPIGVNSNATLNLLGQGKVHNWNVALGEGAKVTMADPATLLFLTKAGADAAATTVRPIADEDDFPDVDQDAYAKLLDVGVVEGTQPGTWMLDYQISEATSNLILKAFAAAETNLVANLWDDKPSVTLDGLGGLYYGLAGATESSAVEAAAVPSWQASQGGETEVRGSTFLGCVRPYYQLRATRTTSGSAPVRGNIVRGPLPVVVTTNGLEVADTTVSVSYTVGDVTSPLPADGVVPTNATVTVLYTAAAGKHFVDGQKTYEATFTADKAVNEASAVVVKPLAPKTPAVQLGVVAQRYPWDGKLDVGYRLRYAPAGTPATLVVTADGRTATKDVTLVNGDNTLVFDAKEAFGEIRAKGVKVKLTIEP